MSIPAAPVDLFKRTFTKAEWEEVENYLIETINDIVVPARVTPGAIQLINANLDRLSASVLWLYSLTKRTYEGIQLDRKNSEKQVYMLVKDVTDEDGNPTGKKRTEAEISAAIVEYLNTTPLKGHPAPIYVMEKAAMERYLFAEAVRDMLRQKADKLITDLGAIKLEVMLTPNGDVDVDDEAPADRRVMAGSRNG